MYDRPKGGVREHSVKGVCTCSTQGLQERTVSSVQASFTRNLRSSARKILPEGKY